MHYKPKHFWTITFEAQDCCGKTSLIKAMNKETNFSFWLHDRGTISVRAYAQKFNRTLNEEIYKFEKEFSESNNGHNLLVYLTANKEDVIKRQNIKNDGYDSKDYDLDKVLFDRALDESGYTKILKLNSSLMSIEEEVDLVLNEIKSYEEMEEKYES